MRNMLPAIGLILLLTHCKNESKPAEGSTDTISAIGDSTGRRVRSAKDTLTGVSRIAAAGDEMLQRLTGEEFETLLSKNPNMPIIDVRPSRDFKEGYIYRAANIPYDTSGVFKREIVKFPITEPIALYCGMGNVSRKAAIEMRSMGYRRVYILQNGLVEWYRAGNVLQKR